MERSDAAVDERALRFDAFEMLIECVVPTVGLETTSSTWAVFETYRRSSSGIWEIAGA
jgi:hypothetical protein